MNNRQYKIIKYLLQQHGSLSVKTLQDHLIVSKETLRKDLIALENDGLITRSYGQVSLMDNDATTSFLMQQGLLSTEQRRAEMLHFLKEQKRSRITELAKIFHVTPATIRNDLAFLEEQGNLKKEHGAVTYLARSGGNGSSLASRAISQPYINMAERALSHIDPGDTIFLDNCLFCQYMAQNIPSHSNVFIITNSLEILHILAERDFPLEVFMLPGVLVNHNRTLRVSFGESVFHHIHIKRAFFCFSSYFAGDFFTDSQASFATLSQIIQHTDRLYGFLPSESINKKGTIKFPMEGLTEKISEIMIDDGIEREQARTIFPRNLPVVICGENYAVQNFSNKQHTIGLLACVTRNYFIQSVKNSIEDAVKDLPNVSLFIREVTQEYTQVVQNIELLIQEKPDLIIDFSLNFETSVYMAERSAASGIPLISIDNPSFGSVYFGANNQEAGEIAGNMAVEKILERWRGTLDKIIILERKNASPIVKSRIGSTIETIKKRLQIEQIDTVFLSWAAGDPDQERELLDLLASLQNNEKCLFIFFHLQLILDLLPAICARRDEKYTIAVGQNYTHRVEEFMKQEHSPLIGCVDYAPHQYGKKVMTLAMDMLNGKTPPPMNYTEHTWVPNVYRS